MGFPIIGYHEVIALASENRDRHAIYVKEFEQQMRWLAEKSFSFLRMKDLRLLGVEGDEVPDKSIVVCFDDGNRSDYEHGFRLLLEYGLVGTFFITTDLVGSPGFVSWENLKEMNDWGMCIQSHGVTHRQLSVLGKEELAHELKESKDCIEGKIGSEVEFLALPGGFGSKNVTVFAESVGYRGVCSSVPRLARVGPDRFRVYDRFMIRRKTEMDNFMKIAMGNRWLVERMICRYTVKRCVRRVVGDRAYQKVWSVLWKDVRCGGRF